jgi:putative DNA primase/helicase
MKKAKSDLNDCIRFIANVHDLDLDRYFIELKFRDVLGKWSYAILPRSMIRSNGGVLGELLDRGAALPTGKGIGSKLISILNVIPDRKYRITSKTGWHGSSFVLPDITIGPDADTLVHRKGRHHSSAELPTKGKLDTWRNELSTPCRASAYLTFGIGTAFAGPLLHLVGQDEGAIFYLAGESSTGKTLTELAGQSVIERASRDSLLTHDATDRGLEEHCSAHCDLMLVIEEVARMTGSQSEQRKKFRELSHKVVGGGGSRRSAKARQDADLADLSWRLMSLWSGENSLDPEFLGEARARGEKVRLIEIPVPKRNKNGIFDRLKSGNRLSAELAQHAEAAVKDNFGYPIRAFITRLASNPAKHTQQATKLMESFIRKVGVENDPWARRFAGKFAVVYAAARLAAEFGVAPWPKSYPLKCVLRLYKRARKLVVTPEEALEELLRRVAKNASSPDRFPKIKKGKALPAHLTGVAWGLRGEARDGTRFLAVHSEKFDQLIRPPEHAGRVRRLLAERGYTVPGKEGRGVRQMKLRGFSGAKKPYFVCVRLDRLDRELSLPVG